MGIHKGYFSVLLFSMCVCATWYSGPAHGLGGGRSILLQPYSKAGLANLNLSTEAFSAALTLPFW